MQKCERSFLFGSCNISTKFHGDLIAVVLGAATQTFAPGGKHPRAATVEASSRSTSQAMAGNSCCRHEFPAIACEVDRDDASTVAARGCLPYVRSCLPHTEGWKCLICSDAISAGHVRSSSGKPSQKKKSQCVS